MKHIQNQSGQALSEYLILTILIAVASIAGVQGLGKQVWGKLKTINDNLEHQATIKSIRDGD